MEYTDKVLKFLADNPPILENFNLVPAIFVYWWDIPIKDVTSNLCSVLNSKEVKLLIGDETKKVNASIWTTTEEIRLAHIPSKIYQNVNHVCGGYYLCNVGKDIYNDIITNFEKSNPLVVWNWNFLYEPSGYFVVPKCMQSDKSILFPDLKQSASRCTVHFQQIQNVAHPVYRNEYHAQVLDAVRAVREACVFPQAPSIIGSYLPIDHVTLVCDTNSTSENLVHRLATLLHVKAALVRIRAGKTLRAACFELHKQPLTKTRRKRSRNVVLCYNIVDWLWSDLDRPNFRRVVIDFYPRDPTQSRCMDRRPILTTEVVLKDEDKVQVVEPVLKQHILRLQLRSRDDEISTPPWCALRYYHTDDTGRACKIIMNDEKVCSVGNRVCISEELADEQVLIGSKQYMWAAFCNPMKTPPAVLGAPFVVKLIAGERVDDMVQRLAQIMGWRSATFPSLWHVGRQKARQLPADVEPHALDWLGFEVGNAFLGLFAIVEKT